MTERHDHQDHEYTGGSHDDFGGLHRDLAAGLPRRRALALFGGMGLAGLLAACSNGDSGSTATASTDADSTTAGTDADSTTAGSTADADADASAGAEIPGETAGPYPADASNGPNVLSEVGIERADITTSFGDYSGTVDGVPTTIALTVVDAATGDPKADAAVYLWHCTPEGKYSIYEETDQNYLRGVASTDTSGKVAFTTVFPGCYAGRWPHCHFEVFDSIGDATAGSAAIKTSQLAVPQADCETVYTDSRYGNSLGNLGRLSLSTDNVFADGWDSQLATASGSVDDGYTLSLLVRV